MAAIPDHSYRILITGGSGSEKINSLFNLINNQPDIDKIYLYSKDPYEAKYQLLINKQESTESNDMEDIYPTIEDNDPRKEGKILITFDYMIFDMLSNKKPNPIVTELFIRGRKITSTSTNNF